MTLAIVTDIEDLLAKLKASLSPAVQADVKAVENAEHDIVHAAVDYIKTNGLADLYNLATGLLTGAATGTPWGTLLATLVAQAEQAGLQIAKGSEAVVLGQAQADLIALGKIAASVPTAPAAA